MTIFRIDDTYPPLSLRPAPGEHPVLDLDDAWYEWKPRELAAEIHMGEYRLPAGGLSYVELVRFGVLSVAESLRARTATLPSTRKLARDLPMEGEIYEMTLGEHVRNIPLLLFRMQGEDVWIYTRTFLEDPLGQVGVLEGRDLADPVHTGRDQVIDEIRRFLDRHLAYYVSMFPNLKDGSVYQEWQDRVMALSTRP